MLIPLPALILDYFCPLKLTLSIMYNFFKSQCLLYPELNVFFVKER